MNVSSRSPIKIAAQVAIGAMAVLFILSIVFFRERLFADTSFIAFNIINRQSLAIQVQRYGSFITQMVPYLALKLHMPLKAILIGYEISFSLFFLIIASVLFFRFRQYALVVLMAFYYLLIVSDSYFFANNELHQAMAWMFLMFGCLIYNGSRNTNITLTIVPFLLFAFLAIFTHFIVIIPIVFLSMYLVLEKSHWPFSLRKSAVLLCLMILLVGLKYTVSGISQKYEEEHLYSLTHFSLQDIIDGLASPVVYMFCIRCLTNYWVAILVALGGVIYLFSKGKGKLAIWTLISIAGYFIIMGLTYGMLDKNVKLFHIETEWQSIGILMAAPFVFSILPYLDVRSAFTTVAFVFIIRLAYILGYSAPAFTWRVHFHEQVLAQMRKKGITKLAIYHEQELNDKYVLEWTAPYESLFQSAMDGDKPQRTFMFVNKDEKNIISAIKDHQGVFMAGFIPISSVNAAYFQPDSARPYVLMTITELFR